MATTTPVLGLFKPVVGADDDSWGAFWNSNADTLDAALVGGGPFLPLTGGTVSGPLLYTATGGTTSRSAQDRAADVRNVLDYGAMCDGVTDDTAAFNAAMALEGSIVVIPAGKCCFLPNGITVPSGVTLEGLSFFANSLRTAGSTTTLSPPSSSILTNANINSVTLGSGSNLKSACLRNLVVTTNATAAPTAGAGVYINTGLQVRCENVLVYNAYDGFYWKAVGPGGICGWMIGCHTDQISGHHVVQDTWPELRMTGCRFTSTYGTQAYIYATGGVSGDILPNTFFATDCHFNENGPMVGALLFIGGMVAGAGQSAQEFQFVNCHVEHVNYIIQTDATVTLLMKVKVIASTVFSQINFFNLNAATARVTQIQIMGCDIEGPAFSMGPAFWECQVVANNIGSNVTLNSTAGDSTLAFEGNGVVGNLTLSGVWGALMVNASVRGGTFSNTATGNVAVVVPGIVLTTSTGTRFTGAAASVTDLSKHIDLNGLGTAGLNYQGGNINLSVPGGAQLAFTVGGAAKGFLDTTGINYIPIGQTGAVAGAFSTLSASGLTTLGSGAKFTGTAASATDLTKHLDLTGLGTAGINFMGNFNLVTPTGAGFNFVVGTTTLGFIDATGINYIPIGTTGSVSGKFSTLANTGSLGFCGTTPIAKRTGWTAATGTATRTTFVTGSVTLPVLAEHVKALIDDLTAYGLIGA
jgi:hypothetical protein